MIWREGEGGEARLPAEWGAQCEALCQGSKIITYAKDKYLINRTTQVSLHCIFLSPLSWIN